MRWTIALVFLVFVALGCDDGAEKDLAERDPADCLNYDPDPAVGCLVWP
jgi:hypothetical protein